MIIQKYQRLNYGKSSGTILNAKVWFCLVQSIENKSAYALDVLFMNEKDIDGTDRVRMFEQAKKGMLPSRGNHGRRKFDLITLVDNHPKYKGTKRVFESPFWLYFYGKYDLFIIENFRQFLVECIITAKNNYTPTEIQNSDIQYIEFKSQITYSNKPPRTIRVDLPYYLLGEVTFDTLAVIGGLYREAYLSCNDNYAAALKSLFLNKLFQMLKTKWLRDDLKKEIFKLSNEKILCPISQYTRNLSPSLDERMKKIDKNNLSCDFLRSHCTVTKRN